MQVNKFEPVYLIPEPAQLTEQGKYWFDERQATFMKFNDVLKDVVKLSEVELEDWARIENTLSLEGVPTAITSGVSQYGMAKLIDHINGKTAFTIPAVIALCLAMTTAPSSTTTGATFTDATYTGYARLSQTVSTWSVAATAATPSVALNASTITFGACTAGTSTLIGFGVCDNATLASGNMLWYGTLVSTTISTTQTPPTIATSAMSLSMTGT